MTSAQTRCLQALRDFREVQVRRRDWICFSEIVDWYIEYQSSRPNQIKNETQLRDRGYELLFLNVCNGRFHREGRSRVWFLSPEIGLMRVTPEVTMQAQSISRGRSEEIDHRVLRSGYLDHWWIGRKDFIRWLKEHHLPISPPRFEPQPESLRRSTCGEETRARLALSKLLREQPSIARNAAFDRIKRAQRISKRGFNRIWAQARKLAGLPARAPPGRKPKLRN